MNLNSKIKRLAELGDEMSEALELLESDPVIATYLRTRNELGLPLWITASDSQWDSSLVRTNWDIEIGELQDEGIYQADLGTNVVEYSEIDVADGAVH